MKRALKVVLVAGVIVALGLMGITQVTAQQQSGVSATRSFNPSPVPAGGGEVSVTISITGNYVIGAVTETLPAGFSYVDEPVVPSDITVTETGQKVTFALVGERSFTYKVTAPGTAGPHEFYGELTYGIEKNKVPIRATSVTVQQAQSGVSATRSFNPSPVPAGGGEVSVTISITGNYVIGAVTETLPAGFSYVDEPVVPSDIIVTEDGQKVTFALVGERSFTYKVTAPGTAGPHEFYGELTYGIEKNKVPIRATSVTVQQAQSGVSATRSFNPSPVPAGGGEVSVTISITGNYVIGAVTETLPAGFSYVDEPVVPSDITVTETGQKVTFALVGERSFTYKVTAPGTAGPHEFYGELTYGIEKNKVPIRATSVTVQQAQSGVSATRSFNPSSLPTGGGEVSVTINISGQYGFGAFTETLPAGFSYVDEPVVPSDITVTEDGQKVTFALVSEPSFTYRVNSAQANRSYGFTGQFVYSLDKTVARASGSTSIRVGPAPAPPPRPTRTRRPSRTDPLPTRTPTPTATPVPPTAVPTTHADACAADRDTNARATDACAADRDADARAANRDADARAANRDRNVCAANRDADACAAHSDRNVRAANRDADACAAHSDRNVRAANRDRDVRAANRDRDVRAAHSDRDDGARGRGRADARAHGHGDAGSRAAGRGRRGAGIADPADNRRRGSRSGHSGHSRPSRAR